MTGKFLVFHNARASDAEMILSLRTDERKGRHLSNTSSDLEAQRSWLRQYASANDQAYFIIEYQGGMVATVRLYDARGNSFSWGSWIIAEGQAAPVAIESAWMVYAFAIDNVAFLRPISMYTKPISGCGLFMKGLGAFAVERIH